MFRVSDFSLGSVEIWAPCLLRYWIRRAWQGVCPISERIIVLLSADVSQDWVGATRRVVAVFVDRLQVMLGVSLPDQVKTRESPVLVPTSCSVQGMIPPPAGPRQAPAVFQSWFWGCVSLQCDPSVFAVEKRAETSLR